MESPVLRRRRISIVLSAATCTLLTSYTKGVALRRDASFLLSFVFAMNTERIVARYTIYILRLTKPVHTSVREKNACRLSNTLS